ncbi:MAG: hypothetical protein M3512_08625 [Bacteroidota bacterium]|nr:hypothetical protein [Bacteroidota bacterium]
MKQLVQLTFIMIFAIGVSCKVTEGPPGPAGAQGDSGPAGPPGPSGASARTASLFDLPPVTFDSENGYEVGFGFEDTDIEIFDTDVIMVYMPYGVFQDEPVWTPLPVTFYPDGNPLKYNFAFSHLALFLFIEAQQEVIDAQDPDTFTEMFFRVAILPAEALGANGRSKKPADLSTLSYDEMLKTYGINEKDVKKLY